MVRLTAESFRTQSMSSILSGVGTSPSSCSSPLPSPATSNPHSFSSWGRWKRVFLPHGLRQLVLCCWRPLCLLLASSLPLLGPPSGHVFVAGVNVMGRASTSEAVLGIS